MKLSHKSIGGGRHPVAMLVDSTPEQQSFMPVEGKFKSPGAVELGGYMQNPQVME